MELDLASASCHHCKPLFVPSAIYSDIISTGVVTRTGSSSPSTVSTDTDGVEVDSTYDLVAPRIVTFLLSRVFECDAWYTYRTIDNSKAFPCHVRMLSDTSRPKQQLSAT
jgi:hypothetical protein